MPLLLRQQEVPVRAGRRRLGNCAQSPASLRIIITRSASARFPVVRLLFQTFGQGQIQSQHRPRQYINILARSVLALNLTLPEGLEEQPYYGESRARAPGDDDAQRRRRLRAIAETPATGAYRDFLLAQQERQKK